MVNALMIPPGVLADGMVKVNFSTTLANYQSGASVTELTNSPGSLDISCYITAGNFKPQAEDETSEDERLCSKQVFETLGRAKWSIDNLEYVYDPQNPESVSNKAYALMKRGVIGYLTVGWGKDAAEDWSDSDIVDIYPVQLGTQVKQPPEKGQKLKVQQKPIVIGEIAEDVKLAA